MWLFLRAHLVFKYALPHQDEISKEVYLDMTAIEQSLGEDVCEALPGMHALTGCDNTIRKEQGITRHVGLFWRHSLESGAPTPGPRG